jgi:hypothetical protein
MITAIKKLLKINTKQVKVSDNFYVTNFWHSNDYKNLWFYQFLKHRNLLVEDITYNFISVFGDKPKLNKQHINIFFCGENTELKIARKYKNYFINDVEISLGFNYINHPKYLRFPLWILYIVPPTIEYNELVLLFNNYKNHLNQNRKIQYSLIASHDNNGVRKQIINTIESYYCKVVCPGKFNNNSSELKLKYDDNKIKFLNDVKFNICPENSNCEGYVTEKLFEAIIAGCIPIYWGANNNPEPEILHHENIVFFDNKNREKLISKIKEFNETNIKKQILKDNAGDVIWSWLFNLEQMIKAEIKKKQAKLGN